MVDLTSKEIEMIAAINKVLDKTDYELLRFSVSENGSGDGNIIELKLYKSKGDKD